MIVGGAPTRDEIEESEKEIQKLTNDDAHTVFDTQTRTWGLSIGDKRSRAEAEELSRTARSAGYDARIDGPPSTAAVAQSSSISSNSGRSTDFKTFFAVTRSSRFVWYRADLQLKCAGGVCV